MSENIHSFVQFDLQMLFAFSFYGKCDDIQDGIRYKKIVIEDSRLYEIMTGYFCIDPPPKRNLWRHFPSRTAPHANRSTTVDIRRPLMLIIPNNTFLGLKNSNIEIIYPFKCYL